MDKKRVSIRFDVDTHKCLSTGVPLLLKVAKEKDVKFTFFINVGRSISVWHSLLNLLRNETRAESAAHLSALNKLGGRHFIMTLIFNPRVTFRNEDIIRSIVDEGHEIGLHGGTNHSVWQHKAMDWSKCKLEKEIGWGLNILNQFTDSVFGFSSPCWISPKILNSVLNESGFKYSADLHGDPSMKVNKTTNGLYEIPTQITAEPGGVAFFENIEALSLDKSDSRAYIRDKIRAAEDRFVVYDHPYFFNEHRIDYLNYFIESATKNGFTIVPMRELIDE